MLQHSTAQHGPSSRSSTIQCTCTSRRELAALDAGICTPGRLTLDTGNTQHTTKKRRQHCFLCIDARGPGYCLPSSLSLAGTQMATDLRVPYFTAAAPPYPYRLFLPPSQFKSQSSSCPRQSLDHQDGFGPTNLLLASFGHDAMHPPQCAPRSNEPRGGSERLRAKHIGLRLVGF